MAKNAGQNNAIITGNIPRQLLLFFFPSGWAPCFQQLYNTGGYLIVGNFRGTQALAAVEQPSSFYCSCWWGFCGLITQRGVIMRFGAGTTMK